MVHSSNSGRLVLDCIDADFREQILVGKVLTRKTNSSLLVILFLIFSQKLNLIFKIFNKMKMNFVNLFMNISPKKKLKKGFQTRRLSVSPFEGISDRESLRSTVNRTATTTKAGNNFVNARTRRGCLNEIRRPIPVSYFKILSSSRSCAPPPAATFQIVRGTRVGTHCYGVRFTKASKLYKHLFKAAANACRGKESGAGRCGRFWGPCLRSLRSVGLVAREGDRLLMSCARRVLTVTPGKGTGGGKSREHRKKERIKTV